MSRITDIAKTMKTWWNEDDDPFVHCALNEIIRIDQEQLSTIESKRGEWVEFDTKWGRSLYYCTNCMETSEVPTAFGKPLYNFCPNCGADMRGKDDE